MNNCIKLRYILCALSSSRSSSFVVSIVTLFQFPFFSFPLLSSPLSSPWPPPDPTAVKNTKENKTLTKSVNKMMDLFFFLSKLGRSVRCLTSVRSVRLSQSKVSKKGSDAFGGNDSKTLSRTLAPFRINDLSSSFVATSKQQAAVQQLLYKSYCS